MLGRIFKVREYYVNCVNIVSLFIKNILIKIVLLQCVEDIVGELCILMRAGTFVFKFIWGNVLLLLLVCIELLRFSNTSSNCCEYEKFRVQLIHNKNFVKMLTFKMALQS